MKSGGLHSRSLCTHGQALGRLLYIYQLLCASTDSSGDAVKAKASRITMSSQRHGANCAAMSSFGDLAASRTLRRALASRRAGNSEPPPGPRHRYSTRSDIAGCAQTLLHHGQHCALYIRSQTGTSCPRRELPHPVQTSPSRCFAR